MCYGYRTVRTEWEVRRAQCGVSGREHVRGRITVPQGDASGLFGPYAQSTWRIDRYDTRSFAAGVRILCTEHGDTAVMLAALAVVGIAAAVGLLPVHAPRDFYGGIALVLLPAFALIASAELPGQRGFAFGPGTAPR